MVDRKTEKKGQIFDLVREHFDEMKAKRNREKEVSRARKARVAENAQTAAQTATDGAETATTGSA